MNPLVSVITTFYNSAALGNFVHSAMESLLSQTFKNIEFICVNDGSTDDTLEHLLSYSQKDERIIIINKQNEGTAQYAKAAGQDAASGDYIMLFDHDDSMTTDAVEMAVAEFTKDPGLDMVGMIVKTVYSSGTVKNINNLDLLLHHIGDYSPHAMSGEEALLKTVGRYDFHFRGLYKKQIFKLESFRFTEKLLNADEIVERLLLTHVKKIGSCSGIYTHVIFDNSSAKSFNIKKIDIVATDFYLREFAKKLNIYQPRKMVFETTAYKNYINAVKAYQHFRPGLASEEIQFLTNRLKTAYSALDRKIIIETYKGVAKLYNGVLLSSFTLTNLFYRFKK